MTALRIVAAVGLVVAIGCRGPRVEREAARCTHVQAVRQVMGTALCEDAWTCARPPGGRFDRVGLHRLALCAETPGPVVLYLPGMHMNGELANVEARSDLRLYLAAAGMRTWGFDYRTHVVPADASSGDLDVMKHWTSDLFAGDIAWALGFVRSRDPAPIVLAGFSQGAALAYRVASQARGALGGLVILDGAAGGGRDSDHGDAAIDVGGSRLPYDVRAKLLAAVIADPRGPSPVAGFPSAGAALTELLYSAPSFGGNGGLSAARDGVTDVQVVARLLRTYDRWWPRAALDADAPSRPGQTLPVLAFASTNMGPTWVERVRASAQAYGGPNATVRELGGYGHVDVLVARRAPQDVFEPVRAWIASRSPS
ncbi:MAG TPA: hypothetical protein VFD84_03905 [Candidatus Binatia bacterium]|nr:hypothetical protein [Candidatus Binatia bacterium]